MKINQSQRVVLTISALLTVAVLFLHNPTGGYRWEEMQTGSRYLQNSLPGCNQERLDVLMHPPEGRLSIDEIREKDKLLQLCFPMEVVEREVTLPFTEWSSHSAVLPWLSKVGNALWAITAIVLGAALSFTLLRSPRT